MTTYYSEHYSPNIGQSGHATTRIPNKVLGAYQRGARVRRSEAKMLVPSGQDLAQVDVIRLMDFKSGDRLLELYFSMDADWGALATWDVGLYKKGLNDDGDVIDVDLFIDQGTVAVSWAAAIARTEYFTSSTVFTDVDRGRTLWELVTIGAAATYTADPFETWTLAMTGTQNISATDGAVSFLCEAVYLTV